VRLRPGTNIALFGGLINQVLANNLYHRDYVLQYTNAAFVVNKDFDFHDGLFSGYQADKRVYNPATWDYELDAQKNPVLDPTLTNPRCVFQLMKKHFARYTPEIVEATTGVPKEQFLKLAALYGATGQPGRSGSILYALGATEHTTGVQNIRGYSILQILLGNMGMPGGGINALRGVNNVQGSTDMALLPHIVPGYMAVPREANHPTLKDYLDKETPKASFWVNKPKFFVSLLKAFWGDAAQKENDFAFDYLPKLGPGFQNAGYGWMSMFENMAADGGIKGLVVWGMNPAVSSNNLNQTYAALGKLEWLVNFDLFESDTAAFWKRPGPIPRTSRPRSFSSPRPIPWRRRGAPATAAAGCSGATRRSNPGVRPRAFCGTSIAWSWS